jgi:hypothetical protein
MNQNYMNHAVNWEAISAIGQFVGSLAVVISLIYVARDDVLGNRKVVHALDCEWTALRGR